MKNFSLISVIIISLIFYTFAIATFIMAGLVALIDPEDPIVKL